jgi:amino acid permease
MSKKNNISKTVLYLIIGLVISVGFLYMGVNIGFPFGTEDPVCLVLTLWGYRHVIIPIITLILIPLCLLENKGVLIGTLSLGIFTIFLCLAHVVYMLIANPLGFEAQIYGPTIWSIIQIPIIFFSYKARHELI